jgi:hypothetical protein
MCPLEVSWSKEFGSTEGLLYHTNVFCGIFANHIPARKRPLGRG